MINSMNTLILEPEFYLDADYKIKKGPLVIKDGFIKDSYDPHLPKTHIKLKNQVLMPGFVNSHSHAFQRLLRGRVENKASLSNGHDFFSWRQSMYDLCQHLSPALMEDIATLVYLEMIEAGFTHVAEFHYVHHEVGARFFNDPLAMSRSISKAAKNAGINLCLLETAYHRFDFAHKALLEQKRFCFDSFNEYLDFLTYAQSELSTDTAKIGAAIHSVRAVKEEWLHPIADFAQKNALALHVHVSELMSEVEQSKLFHKISPLALLARNKVVGPQTTLVHATHLIDDDLDIIKKYQPSICLCPSTEKNLGDGAFKLMPLINAGANICLGTDQHVRLDPLQEAYSLEENERLRLTKRLVINQEGQWLYEALLPMLSHHGLASLYPTFNKSKEKANLVSLLLPPEYEWHGPQAALDAMLMAPNTTKVINVICNGNFILKNQQSVCSDKAYFITNLRTFFQKNK